MELNTIIQGNCLEVMKDFPDECVDLVITDPPYNVLPQGKDMRNGERDDFTWDDIKDYRKFSEDWFQEAYRLLSEDSLLFCFWSQKKLNLGIDMFNPDRLIFWRYDNLINNPKGEFAYDYEPIFVIKKGNPSLVEGKHSCDLEFTKPQSNFKGQDRLVHPAQKPIDLIRKLIEIVEDVDVVLDSFAGSGTTIVAAKQLDKKYIGIEKKSEYCDIIKSRLEQKTLNPW